MADPARNEALRFGRDHPSDIPLGGLERGPRAQGAPEAGVVLTEEGAALARRNSEEARRRLIGAGWEARMRGGLVVWRRPDGSGSWYSQEVAAEIFEATTEERRDGPSDGQF
jgi:hypothetical protein